MRAALAVLLAVLLVVALGPVHVVIAMSMGQGVSVQAYADPDDGSDGDDPGNEPGGNTPDGEDPDIPGGDTPGGDTPGGDTPGGDTPGGDTPGGDEPGGDEPGDDTVYVSDLLMKRWIDSEVSYYVGDNPYADEGTIQIVKKGEEVQLYAYYLATDGSGVVYEALNSSNPLGVVDVAWRSSDESVATVDPAGKVTPRGNGTVTITATVVDASKYQGDAPTSSVTIVFDGQEGEYVSKVQILDENGNVIGKDWDGVTVYTEENVFHQLHVRVFWVDADGNPVREEVSGIGDEVDMGAIGTTVTWKISSSTAFSINADTGRLRTTSYSGSAHVTVRVVGGVGGQVIEDTAKVQLDTGVYQWPPSETLTLRLVYETRPDQVVAEKTFTSEELAAQLPAVRVNATITGGIKYGVIMAEGFYFRDVAALINVDDRDIFQFQFNTVDGYDNPVSYGYLFESGERWYFPNYDIGSQAGRSVSPPILAYASELVWNQSEGDMRDLEDTRYRLVFGCLAGGDANTSLQIWGITGITVVLKGSPSAGDDTDPDDGNKGKDGDEKDGKNTPGGGGGGDKPVNPSGGGNSGSDTNKQDATNDKKQTQPDPSATEPSADDIAGQSKRWRVYQMMNVTHSDVPEWDDENPLAPFAGPAAAGACAVGALSMGIGFWRRLF